MKQIGEVVITGSVLDYPTIEDGANERSLNIHENGMIQLSFRIGPFSYSNSMEIVEAKEMTKKLIEAISIAEKQIKERMRHAKTHN